MSDPCGAQPLVVNGKHDVGCNDGGIHVGEVPSIVGAYPCVFVLSTDNEENTRTEGVVCRLSELCTRFGTLDCPDLEWLLVDGRRCNARRLDDAPEYLVRDLAVREGAAGESILNKFLEESLINSG